MAIPDKDGLTIRRTPQGVIFNLYVQPKSSKNSVVGRHGDALKIKLTAPPVDNAANKMCIKFLAKKLGVSKSDIEIIAGQTSRHKQVLLKCDSSNPMADQFKRLKQLIKNLTSGA